MSVINQMLHDLENRRSQMSPNNNFSYQNLSFVPNLLNSNKFEKIMYGLILCVVLVSLVLFAFKVQYADQKTTIPTIINAQAKTEPALKPTPASIETLPKLAITEKSRPKQQAEYEVATSVINPEEKVVVKKIVTGKSFSESKNNSSEATNNKRDSVVYKRNRELSAKQKAENQYQSAYKYILSGDTINAQEALRNALMVMPGHTKSRELLAGIYIKNGRIVEARTLLQYGMRISPEHTIFAKLYARILMDENDIVTAISVLLRNPPEQSVDADYHALLAALYQKNNQHHEAASVYNQLLKLRDSNGVWWLGMAISLEALGKNSQARLAYEKAKISGNLSTGLVKYSNQRVTALKDIAYP
ncbi:MAG: tetratricopeptide repeat protein [Gammaproteobacteria bacterium]